MKFPWPHGTAAARAATTQVSVGGQIYTEDDTGSLMVGDGSTLLKNLKSFLTRTTADSVYLNVLGSPSNPVTSASATRPTGLTVVYWTTPTRPTNIAAGDVWTNNS